MYIYIVERTQIYLNAEEARALERLAHRTGRTKSQLVREAIDQTYLGSRHDREQVLAALQRAAGAWKRRRETGAEYVERLRGGRLARLHRERS
ncbi:MAG: ribbon-helix-helix protein, CopG family [Acidobacteria bacterium]|nr:ribbon-helix-helix protein, CopG family [Acidobacteriota bacterium]